MLNMVKMFNWKIYLIFLISLHNSVWCDTSLQRLDINVRNPCASIRNAQFVCLDCATMAFCSQDAGKWNTISIGNCATERNFYCNENTMSCSFQTECKRAINGIPFECQNQGQYPDPYDCKTYHQCDSQNEHTTHFCPNGYYYSAQTRNCIAMSANVDCYEPKYVCETVGSTSYWPEDPKIYYICFKANVNDQEILYPRLYTCRAGQVHNGQTCVSTSASVSTTINPQITCSPGFPEADLTNCNAFRICQNGAYAYYSCGANQYFDSNSRTCVPGTC